MKKKKLFAGCAILAAGYMAVGYILKKIEEKEYKKQYEEILNDWKKEKNKKENKASNGVNDSGRVQVPKLKGNVLVIGDDEQEQEKIVIQDLLKTNGSAVVNDPNGYIYEETASLLREKGYVTYFIDLSKENILYGRSLDKADLGKLAKEKIVIYLSGIQSTEENLPEACFLSLFYDQIFSALKKGEKKYEVRFYLGMFGKQPMLPELCQRLSATDKDQISILFFSEDIPQIKAVYIDECDEILNSLDSILFLGGTEPNTLHYFYEKFNTDAPYYLSEKECILFRKEKAPYIISKQKMFLKKEG